MPKIGTGASFTSNISIISEGLAPSSLSFCHNGFTGLPPRVERRIKPRDSLDNIVKHIGINAHGATNLAVSIVRHLYVVEIECAIKLDLDPANFESTVPHVEEDSILCFHDFVRPHEDEGGATELANDGVCNVAHSNSPLQRSLRRVDMIF